MSTPMLVRSAMHTRVSRQMHDAGKKCGMGKGEGGKEAPAAAVVVIAVVTVIGYLCLVCLAWH